jgi:Tfp pilus assembly protein PilV
MTKKANDRQQPNGFTILATIVLIAILLVSVIVIALLIWQAISGVAISPELIYLL